MINADVTSNPIGLYCALEIIKNYIKSLSSLILCFQVHLIRSEVGGKIFLLNNDPERSHDLVLQFPVVVRSSIQSCFLSAFVSCVWDRKSDQRVKETFNYLIVCSFMH